MYSQYYPSGGMNDFVKDFDTVESCRNERINRIKKYETETHYHIFDTVERKVVRMHEYQEDKENISLEELYKNNHPYEND